MQLVRPYDKDELRREFRTARPYPHIIIDEFLDPAFCSQIAREIPTYEEARATGFEFDALNEKKKIQVSDSTRFPDPVKKLNELLSSVQFLDDLSYITGIPKLLADEKLMGGGLHLTGPGGRLDVHIDFNYVKSRDLHRRLNILIYFNKDWDESWGGHLELWDNDVRQCHRAVGPQLNRCVVFETSEISFHGVRPISRQADRVRKSFAAYYYTSEPPTGWTGTEHTTVFKSRPEEVFRGYFLMPARRALRLAGRSVHRAKQLVKSVLPRR